MLPKSWCLLALAGLVTIGGPAAAENIHVVVSGGITPAFKELIPAFEKLTGNHVVMEPGPSMGSTPNAIPMRLDRGESIDVLLMVRDGIAPLIAKGQVDPASVTDLARSKIAMAVRKGAPAPDIRSVAAFKRALLNAKSVAYSDSASGVYLRGELFKRLGIEKQMAAKSRTILGTPVGEAVASGEFELGFQQYSELLAVSGVQIVGLLPDELQKITMYSAVMPTGAKAAVAGRALIGFLASAGAAKAIKASGLEPLH
jgi:molybdate transport system substrate-binding protein